MALTEDVLRHRLASQNWTSHNLELLPGLHTVPGLPLFSRNLHLISILRMLDLLYPQGLGGLRVADLGSLEGGFAHAFAMRGAEVVGVEVRAENLEKCQLVKEHFDLPNLTFVQADVKTFRAETFGMFDIVLVMGLLYHLDQPPAWLKLMARATKGVLFVDTHFAPADEQALAAVEPRLRALGPLETLVVAGYVYHGRWFQEYETDQERDGAPWASYSNPSSFWLTKGSLIKTLATLCEFPVVLEQFDHYADQYDHFALDYPRCMCIGIKPAGVAAARNNPGQDR